MLPEAYTADVLIIGAGPAGMSLACALADGPLRVTLVEKHLPDRHLEPGHTHRALALAWSSARILDTLGLWEELRTATAPIREVRVAELRGCGGTRLHADLLGLPALGYVLDAARLGEVLERRLRSAANLRWIRPGSLRALRPGAGRILAVLEENGAEQRVQARLLIGADGAGSRVRQLAGIAWRERDYGQVAVTSVLEPELPHEDCAREYFTPAGPLAVLPLAAGRCAVVLGVPQARADTFLGMSAGAFEALLRRRLGGCLGRLRECGPRRAYPLATGSSARLGPGRLLLLGNAALTLYPHAAQGFNLVLRDLHALAGLLSEAAARGTDPGAASLVARYARLRRNEQRRAELFTRGLAAMFYNRHPGRRVLRNLGMNLFDLFPGARRFLARRATGLHSCLRLREADT